MTNPDDRAPEDTPSPVDGQAQGLIDLSTLLRSHPAAIGGMALIGFVVVKTYAAARFSLTTASAILGGAPLSVLLGSLTAYAYFVFPLMTISLTALLIEQRNRGTSTAAEQIAIGATALLTAFLSPTKYLVLMILPLLLILLGAWLLDRRRRRSDEPASAGRQLGTRIALYYSTTLAFAIFFGTLTQLWIPIEVVTHSEPGGRHTDYIAHVVSVDSRWTTIVTADTRAVKRLPTEQIDSRIVCHFRTQPHGENPLLNHLLGRPYRSPNRGCGHFAASDAVS